MQFFVILLIPVRFPHTMQDTSFSNRSIDGIHRAPRVTIHTGTPQPAPAKRRVWLWLVSGACILLLAASVALLTVARQWSKLSFVGQSKGLFSSAADLIRGTTGQVALTGEESGTVRVLLLGIGGEGHDGPYLSDTIILAQIKLQTSEVSLTSIPRDYYVKLPQNFGYRKINAAFAEGFNVNKNWDEAGRFAREVVGQISGMDIPYFAVVDFSGFEQAINQLDGIEVEVERTFTDYQYPDNTGGYLPPQTFTAGMQHFDGRRALIYARSRHAAGSEGSDFARSQRQQKIIQAFREKALKLNLVGDSGQIAQLLQTFASHFHTNLTPGQLLRLARIGQKIEHANIITTSLDPATGLICPQITEDGAYILAPCAGRSAQDVKDYFTNAQAIGKLAKEKGVVWIATTEPKGATYRRVSDAFTAAGLTVWPITYSDVQPEQSVLYQVNQKPATTDYIKTTLQAREVSLPPPNIKIDATRSDIILILGSKLPDRFTRTLPNTTPTPLQPQQ